MEEAEALADRVLVLSAGAARCCSSLQELRAKHAGSCTLTLHVREPPAKQLAGEATADVLAMHGPPAAAAATGVGVDALARQLLAKLPGSLVLAQELGLLLLRVPISCGPPAAAAQRQRRFLRQRQQQPQQPDSSIARVLRVVEACRHSAGVLRYSVSCGGLEAELVQLVGLHGSALPAGTDTDA